MKKILILFLGLLLALLACKKKDIPQPDIKSDSHVTDSIKTDSIPDSVYVEKYILDGEEISETHRYFHKINDSTYTLHMQGSFNDYQYIVADIEIDRINGFVNPLKKVNMKYAQRWQNYVYNYPVSNLAFQISKYNSSQQLVSGSFSFNYTKYGTTYSLHGSFENLKIP